MKSLFSTIIFLIAFCMTSGQLFSQNEALKILSNGNVGIGTTEPAKKLDVNGNINSQGKVQENYHDLVPKGTIVMWSGEKSTIPEGWTICDGTNGTPDLSDRFIVGAGKKYDIGDRDGKETVKLKIAEIPIHNHGVINGVNATGYAGKHTHTSKEFTGSGQAEGSYWKKIVRRSDSKRVKTSEAGNHNHAISARGGGKSHENRPPFHALFFLMKL